MSSFSVMLVDDHEVVRSGYRRFLEADPMLSVCAEAASAAEAYAVLQSLDQDGALPDLTVVDVSLGDRSGLELIDRCTRRYPGLRMLVFSMHEDATLIGRALSAGARGYVSKSSAPEIVLDAIATIRGGGTFVDPALQARLDSHQARGSLFEQLSRREIEILGQLLRGKDAEAIGQSLSISPKTIANHLSSVRGKLRVSNDFQLMRLLLEHGLPES